MLFSKYENFIFNLQNFFSDIKNHFRWIIEPIVKGILIFWLDVILYSIGKLGSGKLHLKIVEIYLNNDILENNFEKFCKKFDKFLKMPLKYDTRNQVKKWYKKYHNLPEIKRKALEGDAKSLFEYSEYIGQTELSFKFGMEIYNSQFDYRKKSIEAGYPEALFDEGCSIIKGWKRGTLKQAFEYIFYSVENGYEKGRYVLGECYLYGIGTKQDYKKAKFYLTKGSNFWHTFFRLWNVNERNIRKKINGKKYVTELRHFCS